MNKLETAMIHAIRERRDFKTGNTQVVHSETGKYFKVFLFGNMIANGRNCGECVMLTDSGYRTATTKSRLNAMFEGLPIPGVGIYQKDGDWYYMDECRVSHRWNGEWTFSLSR